MPSILSEYRTYLLTKSTVTDLTSNRIYLLSLPQNPTLPAVAASIITTQSMRHLASTTDIAQTQLQLDCYAATSAAVADLAEQIRLVTEHFRGTFGSTYVQHAQVSIVSQLTEGSPEYGAELPQPMCILTVNVFHAEATTSV